MTPTTAGARPSRRAVLTLATTAALATATSLATAPRASAETPEHPHAPAQPHIPTQPHAPQGVAQRLRSLERQHGLRLGVFACDPATGRTIAYRADERFPLCSVYKPLAASAVLREAKHGGAPLSRRIHYTSALVEDSGYAPITGRTENLANGMTLGELCAAAVSHSDNAAANLLLRQLGGPTAVTRFCRSINDPVTRLDRWEPALNSAEPWRVTDTTSPRAIGTSFARLILGRALTPADRRLLTGWLTANDTDGQRFRAGLPADWTLADKTGGGPYYGVANDVGVVWPPTDSPLLLAVLSTHLAPTGPTDNPLVAQAAALLANTLT